MGRRPRRNHSAAFKAKVALAAIRGDRTTAELAKQHDEAMRRGVIATPALCPGRVLHKASAVESLRISDLRRVVRATLEQRGGDLPVVKTVPAWLFRSAIRAAAVVADEPTRQAMNTRPVFLDYLAINQRFETVRTRELILGSAGIRPTDPTSLLDSVLRYYLDRRQERAAKDRRP